MPVKTVARSAKSARRVIRNHWSVEEKMRRREMADLMQQRLLASLGLSRKSA